jgi:hypothetical protein
VRRRYGLESPIGGNDPFWMWFDNADVSDCNIAWICFF